MKRLQVRALSLIAILSLSAWAPNAQATIAFVQGTFATPTSSQSSVSATYSSAQTAGDLNVVANGWTDSSHSVLSVTDTAGNTYAAATSPLAIPGSRSQVIYRALSTAPYPDTPADR